MSVYGHVPTSAVLAAVRRVLHTLEFEFEAFVSSQPGHWELNSGSLEEQQVFLMPEPSMQSAISPL